MQSLIIGSAAVLWAVVLFAASVPSRGCDVLTRLAFGVFVTAILSLPIWVAAVFHWAASTLIGAYIS